MRRAPTWKDKLATQLALMAATGADVVSSNVTSFESLPGGGVGERRLIRKSQPQRDWDFLFEAAGPGSTYVFSPQAHRSLVGVLARLDYSQIGVHDWYVYALARAIGLTWVIGEEPTLEYRQHGGNVQGATASIATSSSERAAPPWPWGPSTRRAASSSRRSCASLRPTGSGPACALPVAGRRSGATALRGLSSRPRASCASGSR